MIAGVALIAGCRGGGPIDPGQVDRFAACPAGEPHLVLGLRLAHSDVEHALFRFDANLGPCRGLVLPNEDYSSLRAVGGLPDGRDLVGVTGDYSHPNALIVFDGQNEVARVEDDAYVPMSIAPIEHGGPAVAVLWGSGDPGRENGERLDIYARDTFALIASFDATWDHKAVSPAPSGQPDRLAILEYAGLQEYRIDPGATSLATTGELQVALPRDSGAANALDIVGGEVVAAQNDGIGRWALGEAPAFLGPVHCAWPAISGDRLPVADANYTSVVHGRDGRAIALVDGELEGGSEEDDFVFQISDRGECELVLAVPDTHAAIGLAWSGR